MVEVPAAAATALPAGQDDFAPFRLMQHCAACCRASLPCCPRAHLEQPHEQESGRIEQRGPKYAVEGLVGCLVDEGIGLIHLSHCIPLSKGCQQGWGLGPSCRPLHLQITSKHGPQPGAEQGPPLERRPDLQHQVVRFTSTGQAHLVQPVGVGVHNNTDMAKVGLTRHHRQLPAPACRLAALS